MGAELSDLNSGGLGAPKDKVFYADDNAKPSLDSSSDDGADTGADDNANIDARRRLENRIEDLRLQRELQDFDDDI